MIYTIKSVNGEPKEWEGQYGPMLTYKLDLQEEGGGLCGGVELNRKPESRAPQVGERVAGHLEEGKYAEKLKIDYEETKALKQTGHEATTGSPAPSTSFGKSPDVQRQITRQHSQEMAIRFLIAAKGPITLTDLFEVADRFDADVFGQTSSRAQGPPAPQAGAALPPAASPGPEKGSVDDKSEEAQWFQKLLETAGLSFDPAHTLGLFIVEKLKPDQIRKAEVGLGDMETMAATLAKLEQVYRLTTGSVLVTEDPADSEIPF